MKNVYHVERVEEHGFVFFYYCIGKLDAPFMKADHGALAFKLLRDDYDSFMYPYVEKQMLRALSSTNPNADFMFRLDDTSGWCRYEIATRSYPDELFEPGKRVTIKANAMVDRSDPWSFVDMKMAMKKKYGIITHIDSMDDGYPTYVTVDFGDQLVIWSISVNELEHWEPEQKCVPTLNSIRAATEVEVEVLKHAIVINDIPLELTSEDLVTAVQTGAGAADMMLMGVVSDHYGNMFPISLRMGAIEPTVYCS